MCSTSSHTGHTPVALGRSVKDSGRKRDVAGRVRRQIDTDSERDRRAGNSDNNIAGDTQGHPRGDVRTRTDDIVVRQTQPACHHCCANDLCNRGIC